MARHGTISLTRARTSNHHISNTLSPNPNTRVPCFKTWYSPGLPHSLAGEAMNEALAFPFPFWTVVRCRQLKVMVNRRDMLRRDTNLNDLQIVARLQHTVADLGWLDDTVTRGQNERIPLVLVHEPHPSMAAEDQLEADGVVVHFVRHRTSVGNADVRGYDGAAQTAGNEVAIMHWADELATCAVYR